MHGWKRDVPARLDVPAKQDADRAIIKRVAMDIGKEAVSHLRIMYPDAFNAMPKSGHMSLRNCIHNEIMAALEIIDADEIERRLSGRATQRRKTHAAWKKIRDMPEGIGDI